MEKLIDLEILDLPLRLERALIRNGIETANDLFAHLNRDYLLSLRGIGLNAIDEIENSILKLMKSDKELSIYLLNIPQIYESEYIYKRFYMRLLNRAKLKQPPINQ